MSRYFNVCTKIAAAVIFCVAVFSSSVVSAAVLDAEAREDNLQESVEYALLTTPVADKQGDVVGQLKAIFKNYKLARILSYQDASEMTEPIGPATWRVLSSFRDRIDLESSLPRLDDVRQEVNVVYEDEYVRIVQIIVYGGDEIISIMTIVIPKNGDPPIPME